LSEPSEQLAYARGDDRMIHVIFLVKVARCG